MIVRNIKTTREDRRHFEEGGKIQAAAQAGRLGKSWFQKNPKNGKDEVRPHRLTGRM